MLEAATQLFGWLLTGQLQTSGTPPAGRLPAVCVRRLLPGLRAGLAAGSPLPETQPSRDRAGTESGSSKHPRRKRSPHVHPGLSRNKVCPTRQAGSAGGSSAACSSLAAPASLLLRHLCRASTTSARSVQLSQRASRCLPARPRATHGPSPQLASRPWRHLAGHGPGAHSRFLCLCFFSDCSLWCFCNGGWVCRARWSAVELDVYDRVRGCACVWSVCVGGGDRVGQVRSSPPTRGAGPSSCGL